MKLGPTEQYADGDDCFKYLLTLLQPKKNEQKCDTMHTTRK